MSMKPTPITTVAEHDVPPESERAFLEWSASVDDISRGFRGYLGKEIVAPHSGNQRRYLSIFRFDSSENLEKWLRSEERRELLTDPRACRKPLSDIQSFRSLNFWFVPPSSDCRFPSNHKLALVTFAVIWPLVHVVSRLIGSVVATPLVAELASTAIIVAVMTYILMPAVNKLLGPWLYGVQR